MAISKDNLQGAIAEWAQNRGLVYKWEEVEVSSDLPESIPITVVLTTDHKVEVKEYS